MTPTVQPLFAAAQDPPRLPVPTRSRYTLLRVGVQNVWEYDLTTRFVARDGRLLLRGQNESGKTKAIEVSLPAVLDAILRAERLDPFGEQARNMRDNLIGPHTPATSTVVVGYVWAEFGRLDEHDQPRYQTAGYGVRASRNAAGFTSWFFLTDLRPDLDFDLFVEDRGRVQSNLTEILGARGQVFGGHGQHRAEVDRYRAAVNRALFGFQEPTQFDNLMRLLIELRRPQLAKHLKEADLSAMLSTSLPALDVNLVTKVAEGVDRLEEHRDALEALRETRRSVTSFNTTYRRYLQTAVAARAAAVRSANTQVEGAAEAVRTAEAHADTARAAHRDAVAQRARLREDERRLKTRMGTLKDTDAYRAIRDLAEAKEQATQASGEERNVQQRLEREHAAKAKATQHLEGQQTLVAQRRKTAAAAEMSADAAARPPGLHADQQQAGRLADAGDLEDASAVTATAITGLQERIDQLTPYDAALAEANSAVDRAAVERDMLAEQVAEARAQADQAAARVPEAIEDFRRSVRRWAERDAEELPLDADLLDALDTVQVDRIRELVDTTAREHRGTLQHELEHVGGLLQHAQAQHQQLVTEHEQLQRERYPRPAAAPWQQRDPDQPGAPLYLLAAFRDQALPELQQAAVEAALEAAGLLDAWVHPDGTLEHPQHDVLLRAAANTPAAGSLLEVMTPVAANGISEPTARAVLAGVGFGASGRDTWVDAQGRFRIGRLDGQHTKPNAEYVGQAVRERNRQRRLAELAEQITTANALVVTLTERRDRIRARLASVDIDLQRFPPFDEVTAARTTATTTEQTAQSYAGRLQQAEQQLTGLREQATTAAYARDQIAATVGLTVWAGQLQQLTRLVQDYERAASVWLNAEQRLFDARAALEISGENVRDTTRRCGEVEQELTERQANRAQAEERVATLEQIVADPAGQDTLARLRVAEQQLGHVQDELAELERRWDGLVGDLARADDAVADCTKEQQQARERRSEAAAAFARLAAAGVVQQATDLQDWPPAPAVEWSETTVLQTARKAFETLTNTKYDEDARNRAATNLSRAFQALNAALPPELQVTPRTEDDVALYSVIYDAQERSLFALASLLAEDIQARERRISEEDARIIDEFLSGEIRDNLRRTLLEARRLVDQINDDLKTRTTPSGQTINLDWSIADDAPPGTADAVELLRITPGINRRKDEQLRDFFQEQLALARTGSGEAVVREELIQRLDYRTWYRFTVVQRRSPQENWSNLTRKIHGKGSGGSKAATLHLPLFAAAAAFYASAQPSAPRLVVLDEAFAGIDDPTTAKLLDLTVEWDFDLVMTSWHEWMCFPEVPGLSIYEIMRDPAAHVVDTEWFTWNGNALQEMAS